MKKKPKGSDCDRWKGCGHPVGSVYPCWWQTCPHCKATASTKEIRK